MQINPSKTTLSYLPPKLRVSMEKIIIRTFTET